MSIRATLIILTTLVGIIMVWMRVYDTYKRCYVVENTFVGRDYIKTKATLKQFKDLYYISPDKFILEDKYPHYFFEYHGRNQKILFHFSFVDWLRYLAWKNYIEKEKEKTKINEVLEKDNEILKAMYESFLKDIDKTYKQGEEYIKQAYKTYYKS